MKFDTLERVGVSACFRDASLAAVADVERSMLETDKRIDRALELPTLSKASKRFIRELWYGDPAGGPLPLGSRKVHRAATIAAIAALAIDAGDNERTCKGRFRFRMLTTTPDLGIVDYSCPTVDMGAVGRHFDAAARNAGLDALGFIDVAIVEDRDTPQATKIAFHMHAVVRGKYEWFRARTAERAASPRHNRRNKFGLKVCKISSKRRDWGPALRPEHVCKLAYYVSKRSCGRKTIFVERKRRKSKTTLHAWNVVTALRQLECYSHCDVLKSTRGVGGGKRLRCLWKRLLLQLINYPGSPHGTHIDHETLTLKWERVWAELGRPEMQPLRLADRGTPSS